MPARSLGDQRWEQVGVNDAGDKVFRRKVGSPTAEAPAEETLEEMTVEELKDELERRGLPKSGNKDELIARLEEDNA